MTNVPKSPHKARAVQLCILNSIKMGRLKPTYVFYVIVWSHFSIINRILNESVVFALLRAKTLKYINLTKIGCHSSHYANAIISIVKHLTALLIGLFFCLSDHTTCICTTLSAIWYVKNNKRGKNLVSQWSLLYKNNANEQYNGINQIGSLQFLRDLLRQPSRLLFIILHA